MLEKFRKKSMEIFLLLFYSDAGHENKVIALTATDFSFPVFLVILSNPSIRCNSILREVREFKEVISPICSLLNMNNFRYKILSILST